jgi:hypothetical protein
LIFFINIILIKSFRKKISETKKKKVKKKNNKYQRTFRCRDIFLPKINRIFFFSFLRCVPAEHLITAHKTPTPRPRLEGDAHPAGHAAKERTTLACRGGLPCPIPAGLEVTHGQACRLGLPCPIPFGWSPE